MKQICYNLAMRLFRSMILTFALLSGSVLPAAAEEYPYQDDEFPPVTSGYVYLEDAGNGQVLWTVNPDERIYPASMTKVMSAVLMIETGADPDETVLITEAMWAGLIEANASVAGFYPGDEPTFRDLLYGVLIPSGADADNALAVTYFGSIETFVAQMNRKAAELGMSSTHFTNCTGLHDPDHYSTVHDITVLMEYALQNPLFCEIINTREYTTGPLLSHPEGLTMTSTSWPLINDGDDTFQIPGFLGGKTGFTNPAGRCLTSHAEFNGMHLILTTAHSDGIGHIADAASVYSWYAERYARRTLLSAGDHLADVTVEDTLPEVSFEVTAPETRELDIPSDAEITVSCTVPEVLQAPLSAGDAIGSVSVSVNGQTVYEETLYSEIDAEYSWIAHVLNALAAFRAEKPLLFWALVFLLLLILLIVILRIRLLIRRAQRRRRRKRQRRR